MPTDEAPQGQALTVAETPAPPAPRPQREIRVVEDSIPVFDTAQFEHMTRIAVLMADGSMLPESLCTYKVKGQEEPVWHDHRTITARAFMIVNQARIWKADPFAVAQATSFVHNKLCYEGKLVAALIEARLGIRLTYEFGRYDPNRRDILGERNSEGEWTGDMPDSVEDQGLGVRVLGKFSDEVRPRWIAGSVGMWHKGSKSPWGPASTWPRQLRYMGAREWCRAYAPHLMLGVLTDDEIEQEEEQQNRRAGRGARAKADIAGKLNGPSEAAADPQRVAAEVHPATPQGEAAEGFDPNHVTSETDHHLPPHDAETGEVHEEEEEKSEAQREVIQHANPGESYLLDGDAPGQDDRYPLYKDGKQFSTVGEKGLLLHAICREHPPKPPKAEASNIRDNPEDRREEGTRAASPEEVEQARKAQAGQAEQKPGSLADELAGMNSWLSVKARVSALVKSDDFKALEAEDQASVRRMIWGHVVRIKEQYRDPVDHGQDITAFALWIETLADKDGADAIEGTFRVIQGGETWKQKLNDTQRTSITSRVNLIVSRLRAA